jgi:DNA-binding CsgD family transcriptional regulator
MTDRPRDWHGRYAPTQRDCADCHRPMHGRDGTLPDGHVRSHAHGLCVHCYRRREYAARRHQRRNRPILWPARCPDVDEIAVQRAAYHGDPIRLTVAERVEAVDYLTRHHYSAQQIADRLGMTERTVQRYRARARARQAAA